MLLSLPRRTLLLATTALLAACAAPQREGRTSLSPARLAAVTLDTGEAARLLNAHRAASGLPPVRLDPALSRMAQTQADAMVRANALSHDAAGPFQNRLLSAGIDTSRASENLGGGYTSTAEAFDGWKRSAGHERNLRMQGATRFGIALSKSGETSYGAWWALVLAADPEQRTVPSAGPLVPAPGATSYRWGS